MKRLAIFTGENCSACEALKPRLKQLDKSKYNLTYYSLEDDGRKFRDYGVMGIPTIIETYDGIEKEGTRQVGNIDLSKY